MSTVNQFGQFANDDAEWAADFAQIPSVGRPAAPPALPSLLGLQIVDLTAPLNEEDPMLPNGSPVQEDLAH